MFIDFKMKSIPTVYKCIFYTSITSFLGISRSDDIPSLYLKKLELFRTERLNPDITVFSPIITCHVNKDF